MNFYDKFWVRPNEKVYLSKHDPAFTGSFNKKSALAELEENTHRLSAWQHTLYAENKRSLLIILQGMDTSGKDGVIRHVMNGVNPQGCNVTSFKAPSWEELDHDFLWRIHHAIPACGEIGIFNRSHYEDVLIVRVKKLVAGHVWNERFEQINQFEKTLSQNRITVLKFFLHISKEEQKNRLQARLDDPKKNWKFNANDLNERKLWGDYIKAYEDVLTRCSTRWAPWFVIPSDVKWFRNLAISEIINHTLKGLGLKMPKPLKGISKFKIV